MQSVDGQLVYSATDLVGFLECSHLPNLERAALEGHLKRPMRDDPVLDRVAKRGIEHERRFLEELEADERAPSVVTIEEDEVLPRTERLKAGAERTLAAMRDGADVIYQAVLFDGRRLGLVDFLRRVERPSDLGAWSYEVWDTKLARHPKASAVLQTAMYSEMLAAVQGVAPQEMHLALGGVKRETVSFRVADYAAFCRSVMRDFEALLDRSAPSFPVPTEPEPVEHCDICRWAVECRAELHAKDDLSRVAGLSARQRKGLLQVGIPTRTALAKVALPLDVAVPGASRDALERIHEQARVQVAGDGLKIPYFERVPLPRDRDGVLKAGYGLGMLPNPSEGDLFFDMEGDPFFGSTEVDGIDYLFGIIEPRERDADGTPRFHAIWSVEDDRVTPRAERHAFEAFIDLVMDRLRRDPGMHIYHYAPYEPTAMKRLAGRHGTREEEVDQLLRGNVFVDLYRAVRQGIRASVESYSIKRLEPLYGFHRDIDMKSADASIIEFETWLELGNTGDEAIEGKRILAEIEAYNRDDCVSTLRLRDWLEEQRTALETEMGEALARPSVVAEEAREDSERQQEIQALADTLVEGIEEDPEHGLRDALDPERGRWMLAQLLNWHRREGKAYWWRYFFLKNELTDEERREQSDAIGGLEFVDSWKDPAPRARSMIYRFRFPPQDHRFVIGDEPHDPDAEDESGFGTSVGKIHDLDPDAGTIDFRRGTSQPAPTPTSLIPGRPLPTSPKPEAIERLARSVIEHNIDGDGAFRAGRDLLMERAPRLVDGQPLVTEGEDSQAAARRLVVLLDESYLAIQGPPGSGKTTVGGEMIVDLVQAGKRVGVTAGSHKVIGNLLEAADEAARKRGVAIRIGQKPQGSETPTFADATPLPGNNDVVAALDDGSIDVVGGTTWLWAREDLEASVDVLFIDEAGQMSLADALAASTCATNLVLLGDPQQLDQPLQGTHPPGAERSALAHILGDHQTMPPDRGLFLAGTWRLHPDITTYTSEVFYDGRLHSNPGRERQRIDSPTPLDGTGLRLITVDHEGNSSESEEEAAAIGGLLEALAASEPRWTNDKDETHPVGLDDVLVITPYNAQVHAIEEAIGDYRVGTVDKFQGQQAPISIYSMATSSADEAPRGMEFLYSLNRLNVATSRARCIAVVVASPDLLRVRCRTPRQMRLVNALARFVEMASS
jgi:predicted RecB family nuclease